MVPELCDGVKEHADVDSCSVASTAGGSTMGHTDTTGAEDEMHCSRGGGHADTGCSGGAGAAHLHTAAHCAGYATVLVNGMQLIRCPIPEAGACETTEVEAEDVNISGEVGGVGLDILFVATQGRVADGHEWRAAFTAHGRRGTTETVHRINIGSVASPGETSHVGYYLQAAPHTFEVTISHLPVRPTDPTPAEQHLVEEVKSVLSNPRLNKEGGSLSSVLLNNKAKDSVLYDKVVGRVYGGSWPDFLRAHGDELEVFYYRDAEIMQRELSPHIKRCDARVFLSGKPMEEVMEADQARCRRQRTGEEELKNFLIEALANGEVSQKELLAKLKRCKGFTDSLFPTFSLLMRFLSRHSETFVWASDPDQPTRIGLASNDRYPHHETPEVFLKAARGDEEEEGSQQQQQQHQQRPVRHPFRSARHGRPTHRAGRCFFDTSPYLPPHQQHPQLFPQAPYPQAYSAYQPYAQQQHPGNSAPYHASCYRHDPYQEGASFVALPPPPQAV